MCYKGKFGGKYCSCIASSVIFHVSPWILLQIRTPYLKTQRKDDIWITTVYFLWVTPHTHLLNSPRGEDKQLRRLGTDCLGLGSNLGPQTLDMLTTIPWIRKYTVNFLISVSPLSGIHHYLDHHSHLDYIPASRGVPDNGTFLALNLHFDALLHYSLALKHCSHWYHMPVTRMGAR